MQITESELKNNTSKYIEMADHQDILITKDGKPAARLTSAKTGKMALLESLFGVIPSNIDMEAERMERITK